MFQAIVGFIKRVLQITTLSVAVIVLVVVLFGDGNKLKKAHILTLNEIKYQIGIRQYPDWAVRFATIKDERWSK